MAIYFNMSTGYIKDLVDDGTLTYDDMPVRFESDFVVLDRTNMTIITDVADIQEGASSTNNSSIQAQSVLRGWLQNDFDELYTGYYFTLYGFNYINTIGKVLSPTALSGQRNMVQAIEHDLPYRLPIFYHIKSIRKIIVKTVRGSFLGTVNDNNFITWLPLIFNLPMYSSIQGTNTMFMTSAQEGGATFICLPDGYNEDETDLSDFTNYSFANVVNGSTGSEDDSWRIYYHSFTESGAFIAGNQREFFANLFEGNPKPDGKQDPYNEDSDDGGGDGIDDDTSDIIDFPDDITLSAISAGFINVFNPTSGELNSLAQYMWSDPFSIISFQKLFADPMDCILGLHMIPVTPARGGERTVYVGNLETEATMQAVASQWKTVDLGTLNVKKRWGSYADFSPMTKYEIYLPFIGTRTLDTDSIMGKSINVKYKIDVISGACVAIITVGGSVMYQFNGNCAIQIPITSLDSSNTIMGALNLMSTGANVASSLGGAARGIVSATETVVGMKPQIQTSGTLGGTDGAMAVLRPYLFISRPKLCVPSHQNRYMGYPSFTTKKLSSLTGYTEIDSIHPTGFECTDEELNEIESLLKGGVQL